ncbi:nuclear transport factor 2 family protein [Lewinella sp. IMCC34183]|uniref:nuclear transport factor 2 family protein n=1 Tax=Lewinella sp. IMCC34183 TaxID=2248762 RepID=UPI000E25B052|nr:nuclear transport factor 2 family protein [Lewinella sp. IMCC34183]
MSVKSTFEHFRQSMLDHSDDWRDLLAEDVTLTGPLAQVTGREAFIEVNTPFFASVRSSELHEAVYDGDRVITRITTTVAGPDSKEFPLAVSEWYTIRKGKVTDLTVYFDSAALRQAMQDHRR